jgi:hypothetical protein
MGPMHALHACCLNKDLPFCQDQDAVSTHVTHEGMSELIENFNELTGLWHGIISKSEIC